MIIAIGAPQFELLSGGLLGCLIGLGFMFYAAKRTPHDFNPFNICKKPLPAWLARSVFLPLGLICVFFGLRDVIRALR